jgi:microcin C transport system substrate-binding protein
MDRVLKTILRNEYERLDSDTVGFGPYTNPKIKAKPFDLARANKLLDEAGWTSRDKDGIRMKEGKRLTVEISYGGDIVTPRLVIIKEEAKKAGIEFNLKLMDGTAAFKLLLEKKHQMAFTAFSTNLRPEYWQSYHSDNAHKPQTNNVTNVDNKELDKLVEAFRDSLEVKERIKLAHKIQEKFAEIGAFIPAYSIPYFRSAYWRYWKHPDVPATKLSDSAFEPFASSSGGLFWFDAEAEAETKASMKSGKSFPVVTTVDKTFKVKKD